MSNWQPGQGGGGGMYGGGGGKQGDEDYLYDYDYTYVLFMCAPPTPLLPCRQALAIPTHRSPASHSRPFQLLLCACHPPTYPARTTSPTMTFPYTHSLSLAWPRALP